MFPEILENSVATAACVGLAKRLWMEMPEGFGGMHPSYSNKCSSICPACFSQKAALILIQAKQLQKNVVESGEAHLIGHKLPRQPLVAIDINLDLHGKPTLNPHVD